MGAADVEQGVPAPGEPPQPARRGHAVAACPAWLQGGSLAPCGAFPPCGCRAPEQLTDLVHCCAETSSAKAALAASVHADTSGQAAPAPGAPLKAGRAAQPGLPVTARERSVNMPIAYEEGCCNTQWLLFVFGLVFFLPSCIGVVLPLCSRPRFRTRGHKCAPTWGAVSTREAVPCSVQSMSRYLCAVLAPSCCVKAPRFRSCSRT